jgi:hypothetical protein
MIAGTLDTKFFIGYDNKKSIATASSQRVGYQAANVNNELTYSFWRPIANPSWIELTFSKAETIDYVAIAAHTLNGNTLTLQGYSANKWQELLQITTQFNPDLFIPFYGVTVTDINTLAPSDTRPIIFAFEPLVCSKIRIQITGGNLPFIGVIFAGKSLKIHEIYGGVTPITMNRTTVKRTNESERGQWLGTTIIRTGLEGDFNFHYLEADWVRTNLDPFILHARTKPFFIAWRPKTFPLETAYVYSPKDIAPENMGKANFMSFSLKVKGLGYDE